MVQFFLSLTLQNLSINFFYEKCQTRKIITSLWSWEPMFRVVRRWANCCCVKLFKNENLESTDSVPLQNHPGYAFLLTKSTDDQFESNYQPVPRSKFKM